MLKRLVKFFKGDKKEKLKNKHLRNLRILELKQKYLY